MPAYISGININARVTDGSVVQHIGSNLGVDINPVYFELIGEKHYYGGSADYSISDGYTSYLYFDVDGYLSVDTDTYPAAPHIRLARVITSGGRITNIVDDRIFLFGMGTSVIPHAPFHSAGSSDPILVENLGTSGLKGRVPMSDGSGGLDMMQPLGSRVLMVGSDFEYTTLSSALAAAALMSPSAFSPISIQVAPGFYVENNSAGPLELLDYVHINGSGAQNASIFMPAVADNFLFRSSVDGYGSINNAVCVNCSGATGGAILVDRGSTNAFLTMAFIGCTVCARVTGPGTQAVFGTVQSITCYNIFVVDTYAALVVSKMIVQDIIGTCFTSVGAFVEAEGFTLYGRSGVGSKGCYIDTFGQIELHDGKMEGFHTGVECENASVVRLDLVRIQNTDAYDILIGDAGSVVNASSSEFVDSKIFNPNNGGFYGQYRDPSDNVFKIAGSLDMISGYGTWKGFPKMTNSEQTSMIGLWGIEEGGRAWFNTTLNRFAYWDGYAAIYIKPTQVVTVGKAGADFTSIRLAIDSITDASAFKPYTILVNAGIYVELPFTLKSYVAMQALGKGSCIIMAANNAAPLITMSTYSEITDFTLMGPAASSSILVNNILSTSVSNCQFQRCQTAINVTGSLSNVYIDSCRFLTTGLLITNAILVENKGTVLAKNSLIYAVNGCVVNDGYATIQVSDFINCTNAVYADNYGVIEMSSVDVEESTYGVRTGLNGQNYITGVAITFDGYSVYDIYQQNSESIISLGSCFINNNKISVVNWDNIFLTYDSDIQGEIEHFISRGLNVGVPEKGRLARIGQGLAYTKGLVSYSTDNMTDSTSDGGNLQDISDLVKDDVAGEFTFQGISDGYSILIGTELSDSSDVLKYWGFRIKQVVAAIEGVKRSFSFEIWDGSSWEEINVFAYNRNDLYKYANEVFLRSDCDERILFGIDQSTTWAKKVIDGKELYWSRIVIKNTLTTLPTFTQIKLIASNSNFSENGLLSFLGRARFNKTLQSVGGSFGESGGIVSSNISVGTGGSPTGWSHPVQSSTLTGVNDFITYQFTLPKGIDTSMPISISVCYSVPVVGTSNATFVVSVLPLEIQGVLEADPLGGNIPVNRTLLETEEIDVSAAQVSTNNAVVVTTINKLQTIYFTGFDISNYYADDIVLIRLQMTNRGGTNTQVAIWNVNISGTMCSLG